MILRLSDIRWLAVILGCIALMAGEAGADPQLKVVDKIWGFNTRGRLQAVPNRFQPVSIRLQNTGTSAFDGEVALYRTNLSGQQIGAKLIRQIYLSPGAERWVQFYVFALSGQERWALSWPDGQATFGPIDDVRTSVAFLTPSDLGDGFGLFGMVFPARLFPNDVAACESLRVAILDHMPARWDERQRQAFLDWIRLGGEVHVLQGPDGEHPVFPGELSELNLPVSKSRIGAGVIYRHDKTAQVLNSRSWIEENLATSELTEQEETWRIKEEQESDQRYSPHSFDDFNATSGVLANLKDMIRPEFNWGLIVLMSFAYLAVIFPGCFLMGKERRDYRHTFGVLLGAVAIFGFGFFMVGRRGYDEQTSVRSLVVAEAMGDGEFVATQWSNVFVTFGGDYDITHEGDFRIYSTAQDAEKVNGTISFDDLGSFLVDIPPYSSRAFALRTRIELPGLDVGDVNPTGGGRQLAISIGEDFPDATGPIYAVVGRQLRSVSREPDRLVVASQGQKLPSGLRLTEMSEYYARGGSFVESEKPEEQAFDAMTKPAILRSLPIRSADERAYPVRNTDGTIPTDNSGRMMTRKMTAEDELAVFEQEAGLVSLFVPVELPEALYARYRSGSDSTILPNQTGRLILVYHLKTSGG
ncbi:hypothetical protein [Stratiformator vulcanicus]|uniref:Uncharacterized protein n=1 Tax=Stratiformator vulcanicus TaxID=2527980 RepID=A0A517R0C2_9PLAN|nr:hypothetical protein [Stratiformator vulcanicus]QDT37339.1 hypothetical protein Pan189_17120 [Stratiformator vulcanicus]